MNDKHEWTKSILEWSQDDTCYQSIVFSWDMPKAMYRIKNPKFGEKRFVVGGPAVTLQPRYFEGVAEAGEPIDGMLQRHNPQATRTSTGCIRKCSFCAVPKTEGALQELDEWPVSPIVCDNNLLACSKKHFDSVIDKLKHLEWCDFNQGLDARLLTQHHADRFAELENPTIRLAWDDIDSERQVLIAIAKLRKAKIPRKNIQCSVLIGYDDDTPRSALHRLETLWYGSGIYPTPIRYQPLQAANKKE